MFDTIPTTVEDFAGWDWAKMEPFFEALACRPLNPINVGMWLQDWSRLAALVKETRERVYVASTLNTADPEISKRYTDYEEQVMEPYEAAEQRLKEHLLGSGIVPPGMEEAITLMRAEAAIFREENLPLLTEQKKLALEYDRILGGQTVQWDGEELTTEQLRPILQSDDRATRERVWKLQMARKLADRESINENWVKLMDVRGRIAANAGLPDFRAYRWQELGRFDYTPEDTLRFHAAIEEAVVPAAVRIMERRRARLGLDSVRPWDTEVDPTGHAPLRPYKHIDELVDKSSAIVHRVDSELGGFFDTMKREGLLDLENRKGKAPGGYCTDYAASKRSFIFMNSVGIHDDVQTMLHEGGHAFHNFLAQQLPYYHQYADIPTEFCEVASMSFELLGGKYLSQPGGFYTDEEAARARVEHLEGIVLFWPYMAVVDAFQHWVYTNHAEASDPMACDAKWAELWGRFMKHEDWSGLDDAMMTGWHRKLHIHEVPFYYVEYGLAQLGAVQVWRNSLQDERGAVEAYKSALALGNTKPLTQLFAAAGARFQPDANLLRECVDLIEQTLTQLDPA